MLDHCERKISPLNDASAGASVSLVAERVDVTGHRFCRHHPEQAIPRQGYPCALCRGAGGVRGERAVAITPACDVPLHACNDDDRGPLVTRAEHHRGGEYLDEVRLVCLACGAGVAGSDEDVAKAERARVAWEAERDS